MAERSSDESVVRQGPIMNIPNELVYDIATLLPLKMLFRLALVCTRWRDLLLNCPELWTRIHVAFGRCWPDKERTGQPDLWEPFVDALLARSQDLPLVVDIRVGDDFKLGDPDCEELVAVSDLLSDHMHRVKSLSVSFRFSARHAAGTPPAFLRARAPVLKALSLHVRSQGIGDALTIQQLFAGDAPVLASVELNGMIVIRGRPFLSLPSITQFCFRRHDWDRHPNEVVSDLLKQLPSLQRLTLDSHAFTLTPPCAKPLDLQVRMSRNWDASIAFPSARSICYALGGARSGNDDCEIAAVNLAFALQRYAGQPVRALEMRLGPLVVSRLARSNAGTGMTVKVDGEYAVVDADWIRDSRLIASTLYLHELERLLLHEGNWDDFMDLDLPRLRELTVYLRRGLEWWPLKRPSTQRQPWALSVLRLARMTSLEQKAGEPLTLKAVDVATSITRGFDPLALETLALQGCELSGPGITDLRTLSPRAQIIYEESSHGDWVRPSGWPTSFVEIGAMVM